MLNVSFVHPGVSLLQYSESREHLEGGSSTKCAKWTHPRYTILHSHQGIVVLCVYCIVSKGKGLLRRRFYSALITE